MSQVTQGTSRVRNYCGHYEQTGTIWTGHNLEFTQMLYGGMMGSPIISGIMQPIDQAKVQRVARVLQEMNSRLAAYDELQVRADTERHALRKIYQLGETRPNEQAWLHNYALNIESEDPLAGYYSLHNEPIDVTEAEGGYAVANRHLTVSAYTKFLIQSAVRRFGRSPEFLFFMLDYIERKNIHSYNRFVLPVAGNHEYRRGDVYRDGGYVTDTTSTVPHTIRSSRAYKKKHGLNLFNMFLRLGSPQLFMKSIYVDTDKHVN
ncbi:hypothetical protein EDC94DRAFT_563968 [Helicostylum pulchrum]|nr:hypothetical protein EDC94DRAFT_563968 [Helicostylum pulchrum]